MIRMLWALLLKDLRHEASYKLSFVMQLASTLYVFLLFLFLSRLFVGVSIISLKNYGGNYFPYVLTGIAVQQYLYITLNSYAGQLREAQLTGTFESVMVCPVPLLVYLAGSVNFTFILNTFHILIFLILGTLLGGLHIAWSQLPLLIFVLLISALAFSCIGIFSASYCVIFKKGNPLAWLLTVSSALLGGVYYPKSVLPLWLQGVADWVPMTHCLEALRGVILQGKGLAGISGPLSILALWSLVGIPVSYFTFRWAVQRGRQTGSLGHY